MPIRSRPLTSRTRPAHRRRRRPPNQPLGNGRITPALDATIRIAEALNISIDCLAIDYIPRRLLHIEDHGLAERLADLDEDDRTSLLRVLDAMLSRKRLHALASGTS